MRFTRRYAACWTGAIAAGTGLYAAYMVLFFAWLTATPLSPEQHIRAQHNAYGWFGVLLGSVLITAVLVGRALLSRLRRVKDQ